MDVRAVLLPLMMTVVFQLALPLYLIWSVWRGRHETRAEWWMTVASSGLYVLAIFLVGRWDWVSYYLRFAIAALFLAAVALGVRRARSRARSSRARGATWRAVAGNSFVVVVMLAMIALALRGSSAPDEAVRLDFPLRDGVYYVGQGGDTPLLNYHNTNAAQRYALDVVELNGLGTRAIGFHPKDLRRYAIFGAQVFSPCDGVVTEVEDGMPDLVPPSADTRNPSGNHVVVDCEGVQVLLAHLQEGSVGVTPGTRVKSGEPLALVGNSGNTSEPHLHVHAVRDGHPRNGQGVPILFDGTFAVRNSVMRR